MHALSRLDLGAYRRVVQVGVEHDEGVDEGIHRIARRLELGFAQDGAQPDRRRRARRRTLTVVDRNKDLIVVGIVATLAVRRGRRRCRRLRLLSDAKADSEVCEAVRILSDPTARKASNDAIGARSRVYGQKREAEQERPQGDQWCRPNDWYRAQEACESCPRLPVGAHEGRKAPLLVERNPAEECA